MNGGRCFLGKGWIKYCVNSVHPCWGLEMRMSWLESSLGSFFARQRALLQTWCSKPHASATEEEIHSTFALKSFSLKLPSATCSRGAFVDSCILEVETFLCRCLVLWIQVFTNFVWLFSFSFFGLLIAETIRRRPLTMTNMGLLVEVSFHGFFWGRQGRGTQANRSFFEGAGFGNKYLVLALGGVGRRKTAGLLVIPRYTRGCCWRLGGGCVREGVRGWQGILRSGRWIRSMRLPRMCKTPLIGRCFASVIFDLF